METAEHISQHDAETITVLANRTADLMLEGLDIREATRQSIAEMVKAHDRWLGLCSDRDVKDAFADRMWWKVNGGEVPA